MHCTSCGIQLAVGTVSCTGCDARVGGIKYAEPLPEWSGPAVMMACACCLDPAPTARYEEGRRGGGMSTTINVLAVPVCSGCKRTVRTFKIVQAASVIVGLALAYAVVFSLREPPADIDARGSYGVINVLLVVGAGTAAGLLTSWWLARGPLARPGHVPLCRPVSVANRPGGPVPVFHNRGFVRRYRAELERKRSALRE